MYLDHDDDSFDLQAHAAAAAAVAADAAVGIAKAAVALVALAALLSVSWQAVDRVHQRRRGRTPRRLQRWEGEGGRPDDEDLLPTDGTADTAV